MSDVPYSDELLAQYLRFATSYADLTGLRCLDCGKRVPSEQRAEHARQHIDGEVDVADLRDRQAGGPKPK